MDSHYHTPTQNKPLRSQLLKAALAFGRKGIPTFPLKGKEPLTPRGFYDATTDARRTHMFWKRHPGANIGVPTGSASGLVVVDKDDDKPEARRIWDSLPPTVEVSTGRGVHRYYRISSDTTVRSRKLAPGLDLKGEGGYVVAPPSVHPTGARYRWMPNQGEVTPLPEELLEPEPVDNPSRERKPSTVALDTDPIPEGTRNETLARIAGRLHDGTRDEGQLTADLMAQNEARCAPPLPESEVRRIAASIYGREPCKPSPQVTPLVLASVEYLASVEHPVKGMAGATGWSIYRAALELARRHGKEHPDGVELSVDVRTWAQVAGTHASTISRFLKRTPLVSVIRRGSGRRSSTVVLHVPAEIGHKLQHSSISRASKENPSPRSVAGSALLRMLERLRWGPGRIGKSRAAILHAMVESDGVLSRAELADRLGKKPASLRAPLRWLVEVGLLMRVGHGVYAVVEGLEGRVEEARNLGREPEADRLQIADHDRQRDAYRRRKQVKTTPHRANRKADGFTSELEHDPDPDPRDKVIESESEVFALVRAWFGLESDRLEKESA